MLGQKRGFSAVLLIMTVVGVIVPLTLYLFAVSVQIKTYSFYAFVSFAALLAVLIIANFFSAEMKLRHKLEEIESSLGTISLEVLKQRYLGIYNLYLKTSERYKRNYYGRVNKIRERVESYIQAKNKIDNLLRGINRGSLQERQGRYQEIHAAYQALPLENQQA